MILITDSFGWHLQTYIRGDQIMKNVLIIMMHFKQLYEKYINSNNEEWGMKPLEISLIVFLTNHKEYNTARDFCKMLMIPKSNASNAIRSLLRKDLLSFETDPEDKKINRLFLTEKARPLAEKLIQKQNEFLDIIKGVFTEAEQAEIEEYVIRIDKEIRRHL